MTRRQFVRVPLLLALLLLGSSFASREDGVHEKAGTKSDVRVTHHSAAGLEYLVVEPADLPPSAELPMIVDLHGRGGAPGPRQRAFRDLAIPVRIVLPRGPLRYGDGFAWMPVSAHLGESPLLTASLSARVEQLCAALVEWRERHPTVGLPIVTGFSQGGILAATLGVAHPESISRALPVAGWIPPSMIPSRFDAARPHVPIHALHGADDRVIGAARTRSQMSRLRHLGYPVAYEEIPNLAHERDSQTVDRLRTLIERALREMPESSEGSGFS